MQFLWQPLLNLLIVFYHLFFSNLGLAIIALTVVIRVLLIPLVLPSMRAMNKMRELAPELEKIKKRHAGDKVKLARAQADFYKEKGVNPAAGCLPQLVQVFVLIGLYQGFSQVLYTNGDVVERLNGFLYSPLRISDHLNTSFLFTELTKPNVFRLPGVPVPIPGVFLLLAALTQFLSSKMMAPVVAKEEKVAKKTPGGMDNMMAGMQQQMLYLFPLMTIVFGFTFPAGLVLYWLVFSLFQAGQQYYVSGWGGLTPWVLRVGLLKSGFSGKERH
ncbi:MAG: YidC/Oxa1 family membrane protein insertase [bacterium]|nr:YidC/Oxa1 family membrane protein insertase [bacterium]